MIEVSQLEKRYGSFTAVKGVSFKADTGQVVGLLGPNGAGKTTIMKVLTGYHRPSSGTARLGGVDVCEDPIGVKSMVGYLAEGVPLYTDMTVGEYLAFIAEARGIPSGDRAAAITKACTDCGLSGTAEVRIDHLSKGFRQRVGLAQAILHDPAILILDEPTTGLDPNQILEIRSLIRSLGKNKTVILSTHILQEVEALCSEVIIINEGQIVAQGTASELARGLQGEDSLRCRLSLPEAYSASAEQARLALAALPAVTACRDLILAGSSLSFVLQTGSGDGDRAAAALFDWAVTNRCHIMELTRDSLSLEEIFVKLTNEERSR